MTDLPGMGHFSLAPHSLREALRAGRREHKELGVCWPIGENAVMD